MKFKLALIALFTGLSSLLADMPVAASALPNAAQTFIAKHFKGANIVYVERDMTSFDVTLSDGTKIDFNINGDWTEVKNKFKAVPTSFLPAAVASKVAASQPGAFIVDIDREYSGYKFKFSNRMKVYTDASGNILGQKYD